jgi:hypothetical protein
MKRMRFLFSSFLFLLLSSSVNAQVKGSEQSQSPNDYFAGKWKVLVKGVPGGDAKLTINFERKDTALTAAIEDSTGNETGKVSKVVENTQSVTVFFTAQGYDVDLTLEKKDEDHVSGNMMGMFDAEGDRVKEIKVK